MRGWLVLAALLLVATPAYAAEPDVQFRDGKPVQLQADKAYILLRGFVHAKFFQQAESVTFIRVLAPDELRAAEESRKDGRYRNQPPNIIIYDGDEPYEKRGNEYTYLFGVKPGTYIIAQVAYGLSALMCMGTVKFEAKPGVITDLGYVLSAVENKPTTIPELAPHVREPAHNVGTLVWLATVRPYTEGMSIPAGLASLPRVPADYRAVDRFPNYFNFRIGRMIPVPGVLDYDRDGRVLDLKAGPAPAPSGLTR